MTAKFLSLRRWPLLTLAVLVFPGTVISAEPLSGEQIFAQKCAVCHGKNGEGSEKEYPEALAGDKSVTELAALIAKTMPKEKVGECVGEDAQKVAAYIHEAFYSPVAQARSKPARIELTRLTVRQYRNAVTDLIGSFRGQSPAWDPAKRGLSAEYFKARRLNRNDRVIERTDAVVNFDYGDKSFQEGGSVEEFAGRWQGSVLAPVSGEYEFIVKSDNAARLWVNDNARPLIDAGVKSGSDTEYRQSITLLGGKAYPVKLEFFKFKEKKASIGLWWKPRHGVAEPIPERFLTTERWPETYVVATPFPPDDRSVGYERGTSISKAWDNATTDAAIETAAYVVRNLRQMAQTTDNAADRRERVQEFCQKFTERAFRRPLTDEQKAMYVDRQFADGVDVETAVRRVVLLVLKSPRFLYHEVDSVSSMDYDVAERLAFYLWDSLPDEELLKAASAGKLATREQVTAQAERMIGDLRARAKLREFMTQWLRIDMLEDVAKDPQQFVEFKPELVSDLRTSLDLFVEDVLWNESADFRQLLVSDETYLNGRLAKFYGVEMAADAPFTKVKFEPAERSGVLSHPFLLSGFAYTATSSPIHRGVFVARSVLGRSLKPPPEAVSPLAPDLHPDLSTRERVTLQTKATMCQSCHNLINPLGFTLERFDAVGRYRNEEKGKAVDATGGYLNRAGAEVKFSGARELGAYLANSPETHTAFTDQLFHYLVKQPIRAFGPAQAQEIRGSLAKNSFNVRRLMVNIVVTAALRKG